MVNPHFNRLTPAEAERLALLAEECGEVIHVVGKILRHGYASYHPDAVSTDNDNRFLLEGELTDLFAVFEMMKRCGDVYPTDPALVEAALRKKLRYAHHQSEQQLLEEHRG